jgi:hypothetical protein
LLQKGYALGVSQLPSFRHCRCNGWQSNKQATRRPFGAILDANTIGSTKKLNDETPIELQEMAKAIESLPARYQEKVAPAMQRVVQCSTRRRRILNLVQEALSQLRLDMKYLIFDLEATRRERDEYKQMLEEDGRL